MSSWLLVISLFFVIANCHVIHDFIEGPEDWVDVTPPYAIEQEPEQSWQKRQHWSPNLSPGGKRQHWSLSLSPGGKRSYDDEASDRIADQDFLNKIRSGQEWKNPKNFSYFLKLLQRYLASQNRKGDFKW